MGRAKDDDDEEPITLRRADEPDAKEDELEDEDDDAEEEGVIRQLVPTENPKALLAYYCGIFGMIPPVGLLLGPLALLFGILGQRTASRHTKGKGGGHALAGIILGPISFLVSVGAVIGAHLYLSSKGVGIKDLFVG